MNQPDPPALNDKPARPHVVIVTPARPSANNGNWHTTARWAEFLGPINRVSVVNEWQDQDADLMIALHARRSANSIAQYARTGKPLVVVLTGTDLYRDIRTDAAAKQSLELADKLVVLQSEGINELTPNQQEKCIVIEQSAADLPPLPPRPERFDLALAGHMRSEKDPLTALRAIGHLADPAASAVSLRHAGRCDDEQIGPIAQAMAAANPAIELLGPLDHSDTRDLIRQSRALVLPSIMEGGANVLIEAVTSGVPVLASGIPGSIGLLGHDYDGYFPVGDDRALAALISRCYREPALLEGLQAQCEARRALFHPDRERRNVQQLVASLLNL